MPALLSNLNIPNNVGPSLVIDVFCDVIDLFALVCIVLFDRVSLHPDF